MLLSFGDGLGPSDNIALIGAGGMSEVYKANDTGGAGSQAARSKPEAKDFIGKPFDLAELKGRVLTFGDRHHL